MKSKISKHFDDDYDEYFCANVNLKDLINDDDVKIVNMKDFEIKCKIGSGSYSETYEVIEKSTRKRLAAKISKNGWSKKFISQVRLMPKLNFPSIIKFIGCGITERTGSHNLVILLELAKYGSLANMIKQERNGNAPAEWNDTKKHIILYGIASGMAYIHSLGYIFRNLSPENILLDEYFLPKICDFSSAAKSDESLSKELVCSSIYMAPEVIENGQYSKASDVYSFSMIMYELLTDQVPFNEIKCDFVLNSIILRGERPNIPEYLPYFFKNLINQIWYKYPDDRPSFEEIKTILQNGIKDLKINNEDFASYFDMLKSKEDLPSEDNETMKSEQPNISPKSDEQEMSQSENSSQIECSVCLKKFNEKEVICVEGDIFMCHEDFDRFENLNE